MVERPRDDDARAARGVVDRQLLGVALRHAIQRIRLEAPRLVDRRFAGGVEVPRRHDDNLGIHATRDCGLEDSERSADVRIEGGERIAIHLGDEGDRRQVVDDLDRLGGDERAQPRHVAHVELDALILGKGRAERIQHIGASRQNRFVARFGEVARQVAAHEAAGAGDEGPHFRGLSSRARRCGARARDRRRPSSR